MRIQISSAGIIALFIAVAPSVALTLTGQVVDAQTGNPLPDVNVVVTGYQNVLPVSTTEPIGERHLGGTTDMAGRFRIDVGDLPGIYRLLISHLGYREARVETDPAGTTPLVKLEPEAIRGSEVVVTAGRGTPGATPGALTNIDHRAVEASNSVIEPPLLASLIPNATAFNWGGLTLGPTHLRIRGFDSNRLSVSVNGVPINDPEDHNVYWQNTPDFLSNTHDLQVERGVSNFASGPAGVAGGLNLVTSDAVAKRETALGLQWGTYRSERRTFLYRSGLVEHQYNFTGRFSRVKSDGYRDHSAATEWSYFLAATRFDPNIITNLEVYGGEEVTDLNFEAVARSILDTNRTYNKNANYAQNYDGERDRFQQPHYILRNKWRLTPAVEVEESLFWIQGSGYYEQFKGGRKFADYNMTPFFRYDDADQDGAIDSVLVTKTDLIRRKYVDKDQIGWMPRLTWKVSDATEVGAGLELRRYTSDHYGRVVWARALPPGVTPDHEYYRWKGQKDYSGVSGSLHHHLNEQLSVNAGLEVRHVAYSVDQKKNSSFTGYSYDADWTFVNPRLGASYALTPQTDLYLSLAMAGREPVDDQLLDADNPKDKPKFHNYGFAEVDPERMSDVEIGGRHRMEDVEVGGNVYMMLFTDEIVATGQYVDSLDLLTVTNAPTSQHLGIELDGLWRTPVEGLKLTGDISLDHSTFGDFTYHYVDSIDVNWSYIDVPVNARGNRIPMTPSYVANIRANYEWGPASLGLNWHAVSRQYLDPREDNRWSLEPYSLLGALIAYKVSLKSVALDISLNGYNLLDAEYEPFGWTETIDPVGDPPASGRYLPKFIPAAGRSYLAGVTVRL